MRTVVLFTLSLLLSPLAAIAFATSPSLLSAIVAMLGVALGGLALVPQLVRLSARIVRAFAIVVAVSLVVLGLFATTTAAAIVPWLAWPMLVAGIVVLAVTMTEPPRPTRPAGARG